MTQQQQQQPGDEGGAPAPVPSGVVAEEWGSPSHGPGVKRGQSWRG
jgi:hypothetical protein